MKLTTLVLFSLVLIYSSAQEIEHETPAFGYNFICSLRLKNEDSEDNHHICSASLITDEWLITAANCFKNSLASELYEVWCGTWDMDAIEDSRQVSKIFGIILHEKHVMGEYENDVALIQVADSFDVNEFVEPIPLAAPGFIVDGEVRKLGWGIEIPTEFNAGERKNILQHLDVPVIDIYTCASNYNDDALPLFPYSICSGFIGGGKALCGDAGGPLISLIDDNMFVHIGISYYTMAPCGSGPQAHISTAYVLNWLLTHLGVESWELSFANQHGLVATEPILAVLGKKK